MSEAKRDWTTKPSWIAGAILMNPNATPEDASTITHHPNRSTRSLAIGDDLCPEEDAIVAFLLEESLNDQLDNKPLG